MLRKAVAAQWKIVKALARQDNPEGGLPRFIEHAAQNFLRCGLLKHGFVRAVCDQCQQSIVVAFSCKQRGNESLCSAVLSDLMRALSAHYVRQALGQRGEERKHGAIPVVQRFDGTIWLKPPWHIWAADGAWVQPPAGLRFLAAPPLHQQVVQAVSADALRRIERVIVGHARGR